MAKKVTRARVEEEIVEDVEVAEAEEPGDALAGGLLIITTLCLLAAIVIAWYQLGRDYKAGMFGG